MKRCLVLGAGGFIGHNLVCRLKEQGCRVVGVDIKYPQFEATKADEFRRDNLCDRDVWLRLGVFDETYHLASVMGGAGFIFTGHNDCKIMNQSTQMVLNLIDWSPGRSGKTFFSSSACIYPQQIQGSTANPGLKETDAYPANCDSSYGWAKLFAEQSLDAARRNDWLNVRIARFHNIFGPMGAYDGGREKAPAAICRKVAMAPDGGEIEIWGDGEQTRSFLYIDECLDAVQALMASNCKEPVNIGSEEMVSINQLAHMAMEIAGKKLAIKHISGPLGVRGRNSNQDFCRKMMGWEPKMKLRDGLEKTYRWIESQVKK